MLRSGKAEWDFKSYNLKLTGMGVRVCAPTRTRTGAGAAGSRGSSGLMEKMDNLLKITIPNLTPKWPSVNT